MELKNRIYYEGDLDEDVLIFFMKKTNTIDFCSGKTKSNLKIALIELITNAITHLSGVAYGRVLVTKQNDDCYVAVSNIVNPNSLVVLMDNIKRIKSIKDVKKEYNKLLADASFDKLVGLGLLEIFNKSNGNVEITTESALENTLVTIKLKING